MPAKKIEPLHQPDDEHLTIRLSPRARKDANEIVERAWKDELMVMGKVNPIRVKHSHIYKLAIEAGLPKVLAKLKKMQSELPKGDEA